MRLPHKIEIQRRGKSQDTAGQVQEVWVSLAEVWAKIEPLRVREFFAASGENAEVTHMVHMHYREGVAPSDRVIFNDRVFDIAGVRNLEERCKKLQLLCVEAV